MKLTTDEWQKIRKVIMDSIDTQLEGNETAIIKAFGEAWANATEKKFKFRLPIRAIIAPCEGGFDVDTVLKLSVTSSHVDEHRVVTQPSFLKE